MNIKEYQELAARTLIGKPDFKLSDSEVMLIWNALVMLIWNAFGLVGEVGEVVDRLKKNVFHGHPVDFKAVQEELGDVLWYVAALCAKLNSNMETIMQENIDKLKKRYPDGYNSKDSIERKDNGRKRYTFTGKGMHPDPTGNWINILPDGRR